MTHQQFISEIAQRLNTDSSEVAESLSKIANAITEKLAEGTRVSVQNFGVFEIQKKPEHISVNKQTGERYLVPPTLVVAFSPGSESATSPAIVDASNESFVTSLFSIVAEWVENEKSVEIDDLGAFYLHENGISFRPADSLKEAVNKPFAHFESVLLDEEVVFEGVEIEEVGEVEEIIEVDEVKEPEITVEEIEAASTEIPVLEADSYREVFRSDKTVAAKPDKRAKIPPILIPILGGVAIALASLFFFVQRQPRKQPIIIAEKQPVIEYIREEIVPIEKHELERNEPEVVVLSGGKTLRILAEEKFGNREFWVYIYLKNKSKIKNPNVVSAGTELIIPDISEYDINATNPQSIAKAKALGDDELKRF